MFAEGKSKLLEEFQLLHVPIQSVQAATWRCYLALYEVQAHGPDSVPGKMKVDSNSKGYITTTISKVTRVHVSASKRQRIQLSKHAFRFLLEHGWQSGQKQSGSRVGGRGGALSGLKM